MDNQANHAVLNPETLWFLQNFNIFSFLLNLIFLRYEPIMVLNTQNILIMLKYQSFVKMKDLNLVYLNPLLLMSFRAQLCFPSYFVFHHIIVLLKIDFQYRQLKLFLFVMEMRDLEIQVELFTQVGYRYFKFHLKQSNFLYLLQFLEFFLSYFLSNYLVFQ